MIIFWCWVSFFCILDYDDFKKVYMVERKRERDNRQHQQKAHTYTMKLDIFGKMGNLKNFSSSFFNVKHA